MNNFRRGKLIKCVKGIKIPLTNPCPVLILKKTEAVIPMFSGNHGIFVSCAYFVLLCSDV